MALMHQTTLMKWWHKRVSVLVHYVRVNFTWDLGDCNVFPHEKRKKKKRIHLCSPSDGPVHYWSRFFYWFQLKKVLAFIPFPHLLFIIFTIHTFIKRFSLQHWRWLSFFTLDLLLDIRINVSLLAACVHY